MKPFSFLALTLTGLLLVTGCSVPLVNTDEPLSEVPHTYSIGEPQFFRAFGNLLGPPIIAGNKVETLINGNQIFPSMLAAIRSAEKTINFETYIFWSGDIGKQFKEALIERAQAGVAVNVILDWYGASKIDPSFTEEMKSAKINLVKYHPLKWYDLPSLDRRTHRKLLIVDGKVGFTGGVGIADEWQGDAQSPDHWRENHYRAEGPVVAQLQAAFMDNWLKSRATVLHGEEYFPPLEPVGKSFAQVFQSSPEQGSSSVEVMYLMSIAAATKEILIANAYFVPNEVSITSLLSAVKRGVKVEIIVPGRHIDSAIVRTASRRQWGRLLKGGIKIFEYQPTMYHCKVMVADGLWSSIGSTNFDNRSFKLNEEANLNVLDSEFALKQKEVFESDRAKSREITLDEWENRSFWTKAKEKMLWIIEDEL